MDSMDLDMDMDVDVDLVADEPIAPQTAEDLAVSSSNLLRRLNWEIPLLM
jgi:hypothetical protein